MGTLRQHQPHRPIGTGADTWACRDAATGHVGVLQKLASRGARCRGLDHEARELPLTEHSLPLRSLAQLLHEHGRACGNFGERIGLAVIVHPSRQAVEVHPRQNIRIISFPTHA